MRQPITILFMCLVAIAASAQNKADIEVCYEAHYPNLRNGKDDLTSHYILLANNNESKFYSPMTEYIDSLNSTPEGRAKLSEIKRNASKNGKEEQAPRKDGSYYIIKSFNKNLIKCYDSAGPEIYVTEDISPKWEWVLQDSTTNILGYNCQLATTMYHGRAWRAWFSTEIPIINGPWKLGGLPGLILEAECAGAQYRFVATGIKNTSKMITQIPLADNYEQINRIDFLKVKRTFIDNPLGIIKAQTEGTTVSVSTVDENGNVINEADRIYATRDKVDFIETDY